MGMNLWMNKCYTNFASSYKYVCQMCFQCMISMYEMYKLQMNKFCMIFIANAWNVKFMMSTIVVLNKSIGGGGGTRKKKINHKKI